MTTKKIVLSIVFGVIMAGLVMSPLFWSLRRDKENQEILIETHNKLMVEQSVNAVCSVTRDSLIKMNIELTKFKPLTMAMIQREDIMNQIKHKVGDIAYMKNDSARVVVEDVLIGGGKYNFYVKVRVLYKDQTTKEIVPELIY